MNRIYWVVLLVLFVSSIESGVARAQSSPVDLTEMSIGELLEIEVTARSADATDGKASSGRFRLDYRFVHANFEGYRTNGHRVGNGDLLGPPNGSTYPILQKKIIQQAHNVQLSFSPLSRLKTNLLIPFIRQSTAHESIVPGFGGFTIESKGIGDVLLLASFTALEYQGHSLALSTGVSFPTGSIRKKGHTPAGPGSQLPYTMQLGSGSWDVPLGLTYSGGVSQLPVIGALNWSVQALGRIRTGRNSRGYRLGDRLLVSGSLKARPLSWLEPSLGVATQFWGKIRGNDTNFPGPIYPTPVADPNNFGGTKITLQTGLKLFPPTSGEGLLARLLRMQSFEIAFGIPIHQNLNGPQPEEEWHVNASWGIGF